MAISYKPGLQAPMMTNPSYGGLGQAMGGQPRSVSSYTNGGLGGMGAGLPQMSQRGSPTGGVTGDPDGLGRYALGGKPIAPGSTGFSNPGNLTGGFMSYMGGPNAQPTRPDRGGYTPKADGDGGVDYNPVAPDPTQTVDPNSQLTNPNSSGNFLGGNSQTGNGGVLNTAGSAVSNALGLGLGNLGSTALFPALATAALQYNQAGRYQSDAERYAQQLDPFGSQRGGYQTRLQNAWDHPDDVLNDPAHKAQLQLGMDNVARQKASKGYLGSGNMEQALSDYQTQSNQQYLQQERDQLANLSGAQFGPASAAQMLQTGLLGRMNSENAALGSMFAPYLMDKGGTGTTINNSNGGGSNGSGGVPSVRVPNGSSGGGTGGYPTSMGGGTAGQLFQYGMGNNGISQGTGNVLQDIGQQYPQNSGVDYGPSINPGSGGYGPDPSDISQGSQNIINQGMDPNFSSFNYGSMFNNAGGFDPGGYEDFFNFGGPG